MIKACGWMVLLVVASMGCSQKTAPNFPQGKELYNTYCVSCHGVEGGGVLFSQSVMNGNRLIVGDPDAVIAVILDGKEGAGSMPGWKTTLTDQEVAAVATYIRQAWSNRADAVTAAMVAAVKAKTPQGPPPANPIK